MSTVFEALKEYKETLKDETPTPEEAFISGWLAAAHALLNPSKKDRLGAETR